MQRKLNMASPTVIAAFRDRHPSRPHEPSNDYSLLDRFCEPDAYRESTPMDMLSSLTDRRAPPACSEVGSKARLSAIATALVSTIASACAPTPPPGGPSGGGPDLVVTTLEATGPATVDTTNSVQVPIRVIVENRGGSPADVFKVSTEYESPEGPAFTVAFTVPGQSDVWYPFTNTRLAEGSSITLEGEITFNESLHGVTVPLIAIVDSCSGDEFMPDHCRVEERDEANNRSSAISISLP